MLLNFPSLFSFLFSKKKENKRNMEGEEYMKFTHRFAYSTKRKNTLYLEKIYKYKTLHPLLQTSSSKKRPEKEKSER